MSADEVHRLQTGKDPECLLAQKVFEQGHYAGRTRPTNTRQGTYATAPNGVMLASINSNDPKAMAGMLSRALSKWNAMSASERMLQADPSALKKEIRRAEDRYPTDGLVLRIFSRDLPRASGPLDWRANAWNQDYAWFTREEVRSMLPTRLVKGERLEIPAGLTRRLASFNFVDNVRGQTSPYEANDIDRASLVMAVSGVKGNLVKLDVTGESRAAREGSWSIDGFRDMATPSPQRRGISLKLYGTASFDVGKQRFVSFDVVALGTRIGATQYNGRHDDPGPAPIGFLLTKAGDSAAERVAPSFFWGYGWR